MHRVTRLHTHHRNVLSGFDVSNDFDARDNLRSDLVTTEVCHPYADFGTSHAGYASIIFDSEQKRAAEGIEKAHKFTGHTMRFDCVVLEFDDGILTVEYDFEKFGFSH